MKLKNIGFQCLNKKDDAGHTALHKAAMNGWLNCVEYLVDQGAQVNIPDQAGKNVAILVRLMFKIIL